jgi:hypothetical protein
VGAGPARRVSDGPADMPGYDRLHAQRDTDEWINADYSVVVNPMGTVVAGRRMLEGRLPDAVSGLGE